MVTGFRRRLVLAPPIRRVLRARPSSNYEAQESAKVSEAAQSASARRAISDLVKSMVDSSVRPHTVHRVQVCSGKFWSSSSDSDSEAEEGLDAESPEISTRDIIMMAKQEGFSLEDLAQAERELSSPKVNISTPVSSQRSTPALARRIVSALVRQQETGSPWQGPLPRP